MSMTALAPALMGLAAAIGGYFYAHRLKTATVSSFATAERTREGSVAIASASAATDTLSLFEDYPLAQTGTLDVLLGTGAREREVEISKVRKFLAERMGGKLTESEVQGKSPKRTRSGHESES